MKSLSASLISLFLFVSSLCIGASVLAADALMNAQIKFQRDYLAATKHGARRDLVIKAIDDGLIKRGVSLREATLMFGGDLQTFRRDSTNSLLKAVVFYEPTKTPPKPLMSAIRQGW